MVRLENKWKEIIIQQIILNNQKLEKKDKKMYKKKIKINNYNKIL